MRVMWHARLFACACIALLTACAPLPPAGDAPPADWQGRLGVTVQSDPPQSSSGGFALRGNARQGRLQLFSPLGTTVAELAWDADSATLTRGPEPERYASLDTLTEQLTGATLPLAALFDWLKGRDTPQPGWQTDLSEIQQGRLVAHRSQPLPEVTLRIRLERPE